MRAVRIQIGPRFRSYTPGQVVDLPDEEAAQLVEAGLAVVLPDPEEHEDEPVASGEAGATDPEPPDPGTDPSSDDREGGQGGTPQADEDEPPAPEPDSGPARATKRVAKRHSGR